MSKNTKFWIYRILAILFTLWAGLKLVIVWATFVDPKGAVQFPEAKYGQLWDIVLIAPIALLLFKRNKWGLYLAIAYLVFVTMVVRMLNT